MSEQEIHYIVHVWPNPSKWLFSAIYANTCYQVRSLLWDKLKSLHDNYNSPWLIEGDFNDVIIAAEKFGEGGRPINNKWADSLTNCINYCNLLDLGFKGSRYIWKNKRKPGYTILERLDRTFANHGWLNLFPNAMIRHLTRTHSDHCPLLITLQPPKPQTQKYFRFEIIWATHPNFNNLVQQSWNPHQNLLDATKSFLDNVTSWNKYSFGNIFI